MRIDSIELFRVPLECSESDGAIDSVFVVMRSGGEFGTGEMRLGRAPRDCVEWSTGVFACLRDWLAPALVGKTINRGEQLQEALRQFQGNSRAKSALDIAWWDLAATKQKKPLYQLLGGNNNPIPLSATIGVQNSLDDLFVRIGEAFQFGHDHVTLKFRPGWDLEMLRAVRQVFPAEPIAIDCGGLCTLGQQEMFYRLEDFFLKYIEQPLSADDLVGHAMLQQSIRTPIMLHESISSIERLEQAIDLGSCRQVRIDLGNVGGLTPALAIAQACGYAKIPWATGGGPQNGVAAQATAALATLSNLSLPDEAYGWVHTPWMLFDSTTLAELNGAGKYSVRLPNDIPGCCIILDLQILADMRNAEHTVVS